MRCATSSATRNGASCARDRRGRAGAWRRGKNCLRRVASVEYADAAHAVLSRKEKAMSHLVWPLLLVLLLLAPTSVLAQSSAVAAPGPGVSVAPPAHPALPWALGPAIPVGQLIRDIWVQPQQVIIDSAVEVPVIPAGEPGAASLASQASTDGPQDKGQEPA